MATHSNLLVLITIVANVSFLQADPAKFMESHDNRRLFTPEVVAHMPRWNKFVDYENDFSGFRKEFNGKKYRNKLCEEYHGIDHPNLKGCCPVECGDFCGRDDCQKGPGGNTSCCEGQTEKFCGPHQTAPCLLNATKLAKVFADKQCKQYNGIDHPGGGACCSPLCGEFCGTELCKEGPGGESQCCASSIEKTCGEDQSAPCLLPPSAFATFLRWIVFCAILLIAAITYFLTRPSREAEAYAPLKPEPMFETELVPVPANPEPIPDVPVNPEPEGLPLTWETGSGEITVFATQKPLGLTFEKHNPIEITAEMDSHGKDLGIKVGWILKAIDYVDITGLDFNEADQLLHQEVGKLPGGIPLTWDTGSGEETVWASKQPLGLSFEKGHLPIRITKEDEGHGKDIGVKIGWYLKKVNYQDVSHLTDYEEVDSLMREEVGKLPRNQSIQ